MKNFLRNFQMQLNNKILFSIQTQLYVLLIGFLIWTCNYQKPFNVEYYKIDDVLRSPLKKNCPRIRERTQH